MSPPESPSRRSPSSGAPSAPEVRAEVDRILASADFKASKRRRDLLRHCVEAGVAGRTNQLKGYVIATELFGRGADFDPLTDPIVRIEIGRLRRDLEHYYLASGADDPLLISIPKGGNTPSFEVRERLPGPRPRDQRSTPLPASEESVPVRRAAPWSWVAVALMLAIGLAFAWQRYRGGSHQDLPSERPPAPTSAVRAGKVTIVILPFDYTSDSIRHPFLDGGLVNEVVGALAGHPGLAVVAPGTAAQIAARGLTPPEIAELLAVDHVVRGDIRQEGRRIRVTISMIEPRTSIIQLSKSYDAMLEGVLDLQSKLARDLAAAVAAEVTPSLERRLRQRGNVNSELLALYQEATALRHPPSDPVRSKLAEDAYRRVIELDADFARGHAGLAYVLAFRSWWDVGDQPDADARSALDAARLAIDKDQDSAQAHLSLAIALHVTGDRGGSLAAVRRALTLAPSDPYVLAFTGIFRAFAGDFDSAVTPARKAVSLDPLSVRRPFRNMAGIVLFHAGGLEEAHELMSENVRLGGPDGPHMAYYRAAALARLGRMEEARAELEVAARFPYEFDIRDFLSAFSHQRDAAEVLDALTSIGADLDSPGRSGA